MILKRTIKLLKEYLNMNNIELSEINNYRLNEIMKTKDYFNNEINERKNIIKKLNKYLVTLIISIKYLLLYQHHLVH